MTNASGRDYSSFQGPLTAGDLAGLDFVFARVSDWSGGDKGTDPNFAANWAAAKTAGKVRGAYWYLIPDLNPVQQARYFVNAVKKCGLEAGDILVCDSETAAANVDNVTEGFCAATAELAGPHCPVLVYSDQAVGRQLVSCTKYGLWLAWPGDVEPGPAQCAPWKTWVFWQNVQTPLDGDQFNGDAAALTAWRKKYLPAPKPPVWKDSNVSQLMKSGVGSVTPVAVPKGAKSVVLVAEDTATVGVQIHNHGQDNYPITWAGGSKTVAIPDGVQAVHLHMVAATGDVSFVVE